MAVSRGPRKPKPATRRKREETAKMPDDGLSLGSKVTHESETSYPNERITTRVRDAQAVASRAAEVARQHDIPIEAALQLVRDGKDRP